jgi:type IV secretory pathway TraG/TraD family ATPase VirD4
LLATPCSPLGSWPAQAAAYNPLLLVPRGQGDLKHAQAVAEVLVDPEGRDQPRTFWEQSAHSLLTGIEFYKSARPLAGPCWLLSRRHG